MKIDFDSKMIITIVPKNEVEVCALNSFIKEFKDSNAEIRIAENQCKTILFSIRGDGYCTIEED